MNDKNKNLIPASIVLAGFLVASALLIRTSSNIEQSSKSNLQSENFESVISDSIELPVIWGDLGKKLVSVGAIDQNKWEALYGGKEAMTKEEITLLGENNGKLKITKENAGYLLNLFWVLGLTSQNPILDSGEMTDSRYGGAQNFASTAGWTIADGNQMDHYSKHKFFTLTAEEQKLVDKVSKGIYRPCCNNSTHFPDCNHGMAMLGLLELMVSQGVSEEDMWKTALNVNTYWFPDNYETIAVYLKSQGLDWNEMKPEELLGLNYSSVSGFARITEAVASREQSGGVSCGVSGGVQNSKSVQSGPSCGI